MNRCNYQRIALAVVIILIATYKFKTILMPPCINQQHIRSHFSKQYYETKLTQPNKHQTECQSPSKSQRYKM